MTDSYDDSYYIEIDNNGVEYTCFIDAVNSNDWLFDDELIECTELELEDDIEDLDFDD
jgi:hypothetical protein